MCKLFYGHMSSILLSIYLGMELLGHMIILFNFLRNYQNIFTMASPFYIPTKIYKGSNFSTFSQHLLFSLPFVYYSDPGRFIMLYS